MTDLFDDDDLFAPRPAPAAPPPPPKPAPIRRKPTVAERIVAKAAQPAGTSSDAARHPVASLACPCGARDEVKEPCPDALDCWKCGGTETIRRFAPRFLPPPLGGRDLTPIELRGLALDAKA